MDETYPNLPWPDDRQLIQGLAEYASSYGSQVVIDYYRALRARSFVILAGPAQVDKAGLAQALAEQMVGQDCLRNCHFQAHPWWVAGTGRAACLAEAHTQFNALKLFDALETAADGERFGLPVFVVAERLSPAEVMAYFEDLPRGLLWQAGGETARIELPRNLFVTGTLDVEETQELSFSPTVLQHAAVIRLEAGGRKQYLSLALESDGVATRSQSVYA